MIWGLYDSLGNEDPEEIVSHYGTPRHSGRYPYGSGDNPYQHATDFLGRIDILKRQGYTETQIAKDFGLTTSQFRVQKSLATNERRAMDVETARKLLEYTCVNVSEVARRMGKNESSIRSLLKTSSESTMSAAHNTANFLKEQINKKGMIDVGAGVEHQLNVSPEMMKNALYILEREGYPV